MDHSVTMQLSDPAGESLRLSEHYRQLADGELVVLARDTSELTDLAQQALAAEIHHRRLKPELELDDEPEKASSTPVLESSPHSDSKFNGSPDDQDSAPQDPYAEDRELVELCTVWSLADALQVQRLLDRASIPFFMGPAKATGVERVTSNFTKGVSVKVMRIGIPWALEAMTNYEPTNEPPRQPERPPEQLPVRCPQCNSSEVIFHRLVAVRRGANARGDETEAQDDTAPRDQTGDSFPNFEWACGTCGHRWQDDGLAKE